MKRSKKLLSLVLSLILVFSLIPAVVSSADGNTASYELIHDNANPSFDGSYPDDVWCGDLNIFDNPRMPSIVRTVNADGHLVLKDVSGYRGGDDAVSFANVIGLGGIIKPNSDYTVTAKVKFDSNPTDGTHATAIENLGIAYCVLCFSGQDDTMDYTADTNGEYVTLSINFTSGATVTGGGVDYIQIGAYDSVYGYCGYLAPGASIEVESCVITGDLLKSDPKIGDKTAELVKPGSAGASSWDVINGVWSGVLDQGVNPPCMPTRTITEKGTLLIKSDSDENTGTVDHGVGNRIGVSDILKPNTSYTFTVKVKYDSNLNHVLHQSDSNNNYKRLYIRYGVLGGAFGTDYIEIYDTEGEFRTYKLTFTTGETVPEGTYLQVGGSLPGFNNCDYCCFCPGASIEIESAVLRGDLNYWDLENTEEASLFAKTEGADVFVDGGYYAPAADGEKSSYSLFFTVKFDTAAVAGMTGVKFGMYAFREGMSAAYAAHIDTISLADMTGKDYLVVTLDGIDPTVNADTGVIVVPYVMIGNQMITGSVVQVCASQFGNWLGAAE